MRKNSINGSTVHTYNPEYNRNSYKKKAKEKDGDRKRTEVSLKRTRQTKKKIRQTKKEIRRIPKRTRQTRKILLWNSAVLRTVLYA